MTPRIPRVGDRVTTEYRREDKNVVRMVTSVEKFARCTSGWLVAADGGEPCPSCGRPPVPPVPSVDSSWFRLEGGSE